MRHCRAEPDMPVEPEAALHRVYHAGAPIREFSPDRRHWRVGAVIYWQYTAPSVNAMDGGDATVPKYSAQVNGNDEGCVACADHPDADAVPIVTVTPLEGWYLSSA